MPQRFHLRDAMLLITGLAVSLWLIVPMVRSHPSDPAGTVFAIIVMMLGGLSLWGPPLLLTEIRSRKRPWGPGKILWFATGTATWLMWPPMVYRRATGGADDQLGTSGICFAYGTPLMAVYVTAALLAGGWLRRRRRHRRPLSWREQFGLWLGLVWACTGLYVLYLIYAEKLR